MHFQPCAGVGEQGEANGMGFRETVKRERLERGDDLCALLRLHAFFLHPRFKFHDDFFHALVRTMKADGAAEFLGLAAAKVAQQVGLSETALYYIGGIIKHAKALNAFTNASTNSYKRLVPGFEAPVMLAYSARNRSASIRIPFVNNPKGRRIEVRFPDSTANPYLAFAAMMMAGLDGIQNKIHPGDAMDKDLYDLPAEEAKAIPQVCHSFDQALDALDNDRDFLKQGGVFTDDVIDGYIALKMEEVTRIRMSTHPVEYDMYYSL